MPPEPIRAALTVPLADSPAAPDDIQYMPPGRHTNRMSTIAKHLSGLGILSRADTDDAAAIQ